jgi:hypothetical protein
MLGMTAGPARVAAEMADRAVADRLAALEGALFQLVLARTEADGLRDLAAIAGADEAEELAGRLLPRHRPAFPEPPVDGKRCLSVTLRSS